MSKTTIGGTRDFLTLDTGSFERGISRATSAVECYARYREILDHLHQKNRALYGKDRNQPTTPANHGQKTKARHRTT